MAFGIICQEKLRFREIQLITILSEVEEASLVWDWYEARLEYAADRLILAHLRLIPPIARRIARAYGLQPSWGGKAAFEGFREVVDELVAEGELALVEIVKGSVSERHPFDPCRRARFSTYARIWLDKF